MFCIVVERALHDALGHYAYRIGYPAPFAEPILFDRREDAEQALKMWNTSYLWQYRVAKVSKELCIRIRKGEIKADKNWQHSNRLPDGGYQ